MRHSQATLIIHYDRMCAAEQEAADFDLCEMIRAPVFVRGKAGFAALAEGLRDFAHRETASDLAGLDGAFVGQRERDNWAAIGD